jgi:hypothetical protein
MPSRKSTRKRTAIAVIAAQAAAQAARGAATKHNRLRRYDALKVVLLQDSKTDPGGK